MAKKKLKILKSLVTTDHRRPSQAAFLDHFFAIAGGPEKVAQMAFDEYIAAPVGSMLRIRFMETILRQLGADDAKRGLGDDTGLLSDADLDRELAAREAAIVPHLGAYDDAGDAPAAGAEDPPPPAADPVPAAPDYCI